MIKQPVRDTSLWIHENEALSNHIRREGDFFEAPILDYLRDRYSNHRNILDIGANIGNHAVYFANYFTYDGIYCFEPVIENFRVLEKNIEPYRNVAAFPYAISSKTGKVRIDPNPGNMGASEISPDAFHEVQSLALDRIGFQRITLMKIDVERHEPEVLDGAQDTIYKNRPLILIEDADEEYAKLLPDYKLIQGWPEHKTYLYGWK